MTPEIASSAPGVRRSADIRHLRAIVSVAGLGLALLSPSVVAADPIASPSIRLADARRIELPGTRILSMSPDGSSIAAVRPAVGYARGELCAFDVATLAERACASVADLGSTLRIEDVTWSPDGALLAYAANAFQTFRDGDLWLMDVATGEVRNLDDDGFEGSLPFGQDAPGQSITVDVAPTFTPDGRFVTFSRSTFQGGIRLGNDIASVPVEGGPPRHLTDVSEDIGIAYHGMAWAPDGSALFYSYHGTDPEDPRNGIWRVAADGSGARLLAGLTDPRIGAPAVTEMSPTGDRLLAWYPMSAMQLSGPDALAIVDTGTGAVTPLALDPSPSPIAAIQMATFAPDGRSLLEVTIRTDPDHQVRVRDLASGVVSPLVAPGLPTAGPPQHGMMPTWATNGTALVTGGGDLSGATLLTLEGGLGAGSD